MYYSCIIPNFIYRSVLYLLSAIITLRIITLDILYLLVKEISNLIANKLRIRRGNDKKNDMMRVKRWILDSYNHRIRHLLFSSFFFFFFFYSLVLYRSKMLNVRVQMRSWTRTREFNKLAVRSSILFVSSFVLHRCLYSSFLSFLYSIYYTPPRRLHFHTRTNERMRMKIAFICKTYGITYIHAQWSHSLHAISLRSDACADNNALSSSSFVHAEIANDVVMNANIILSGFSM